MIWLLAGAVVLAVAALAVWFCRKDPQADWTVGNFCLQCGSRHPEDFGSLGPCPRCGGMDYEIRKGPPRR